jgi:Holliday junction resolvase RusA-like endonuclease
MSEQSIQSSCFKGGNANVVLINTFIAGEPKPQPRPRAFAKRMGNGGFAARVYDAGTAEGWKGDVAIGLQKHLGRPPIEGAVSVTVNFILPRPGRLARKKDPEHRLPAHDCPYDVDNLFKGTIDAMTRLGVWKDDRQVVETVITKRYAAKSGDHTGCHLIVELIGEGAH